MSDTRPWLESKAAPESVLALLRHAKPPGALDAVTRERSRRRLAQISALPAAAGAFLWLKHVALGAVLGSAALAVVSLPELLHQRTSAPSPSAAAAPARQRRVAPLATGASQSAAASNASESAAPSALQSASPASAWSGDIGAPAPRKTVAEAKASVGAASAKSEPESELVREARLLDLARGRLSTDPAGALVMLAQHERDFGGGALGLEREFLSVAALVKLGRRAEAEARAERLRTLAPGSLYQERLTAVLHPTAGAEPTRSKP
ncbi:MAG TPA: hypothetical protein VFQ35_20370 [Polyangiaceae bacterium]|nr:hypothetical protein [Polyangiaceae bacterium]